MLLGYIVYCIYLKQGGGGELCHPNESLKIALLPAGDNKDFKKGAENVKSITQLHELHVRL